MQFQEFARVQIGNGPGSWYVVSDPCPWQDHVVFIKRAGLWTDASEQLLDNSGF